MKYADQLIPDLFRVCLYASLLLPLLPNLAKGQAERQKLADVSISGRRNDLYRMEELSREALFEQLGIYARGALSDTLSPRSDSLWASLPEKIQFFRFFGHDKHREEQKECEINAWNLLREAMADEKFRALAAADQYAEFDLRWRTQYPSCYYFYRKLAPILDFQLNPSLLGPALLAGVEAEIIFRTPSQASGILARRAKADLLLPMEALGRVPCLNQNRPDYQPFTTETFPLVLSQLVWSESYFRTIPGKYPPRELFLLRFRFRFEGGGGQSEEVCSVWILLQV